VITNYAIIKIVNIKFATTNFLITYFLIKNVGITNY